MILVLIQDLTTILIRDIGRATVKQVMHKVLDCFLPLTSNTWLTLFRFYLHNKPWMTNVMSEEYLKLPAWTSREVCMAETQG